MVPAYTGGAVHTFENQALSPVQAAASLDEPPCSLSKPFHQSAMRGEETRTRGMDFRQITDASLQTVSEMTFDS